jgi:CRISPR-associated endoribonuclease Cas6
MQYFELKCTAYIKEDIPFKESFEIISKYISFSMAQNERLKTIHEINTFKYYTFGSFYPVEKDKVYKKGNSYTFTIRTVDADFAKVLEEELRKNINNPNFLIVQVHKRSIKEFFVSELYSVTPVIVTIDKGLYWTPESDGDIIKLQRQLHDNLEKKYQEFYKEKLTPLQNFIQLIEIKNRKPQTIQITKDGKKIRFFGNKFRIVPHEDEVSQKLAFMALGSGLGEKNSFGGGFCLGKGDRV